MKKENKIKEVIRVENKLTWEGTIPMYIEILKSDVYSQRSKEIIKEELMRLAKLVDELNGKEIVKE